MAAMDEDLRHGALPARAVDHLDPLFVVEGDVDLLEVERLAVQELLRRAAIAAEGRGVEEDARHAWPPWEYLQR